jgi:uncharacterized repeat protein (TIGR01451 family)
VRRKILLRVLASVAVAIGSQAAYADGEVQSSLIVSRVAPLKDGRETLQPASAAKPGEVLEYRLQYHNAGKQTARQLEATLPIPAGTELLSTGALPSIAQASLDGKKFAPLPLRRAVKKPDGTTEMQLVPAAEYRAIRWQPQDLQAGKSLTYVARVRISNAPTAAAP